MALSGIGTPLTVSPASLGFGAQKVSTSSNAQTVNVFNPATTAMAIASIVPSGDYSLTHTCGTSIAALGSCVITPGTILIISPAGSQTIAVNGAAVNFALSLTPGGSGSASVTAGQTATYNLSLSPGRRLQRECSPELFGRAFAGHVHSDSDEHRFDRIDSGLVYGHSSDRRTGRRLHVAPRAASAGIKPGVVDLGNAGRDYGRDSARQKTAVMGRAGARHGAAVRDSMGWVRRRRCFEFGNSAHATGFTDGRSKARHAHRELHHHRLCGERQRHAYNDVVPDRPVSYVSGRGGTM